MDCNVACMGAKWNCAQYFDFKTSTVESVQDLRLVGVVCLNRNFCSNDRTVWL
jgi:hypothetical protein